MTLIDLVPPEVVIVEAFGDLPGEEPFPGEEHLIARATEGRRREFITGRGRAPPGRGRRGGGPRAHPYRPQRGPGGGGRGGGRRHPTARG
ncbi:hypothetical protein ACFY36_44995, partial [Actinoplanes sp. NPDC000266]